MSSLSQKLLKTTHPLIQFQRYRGKINIQKPRQPHYERARVLAVTQPLLPKKDLVKNCFQSSSKLKDAVNKIENPYNDIIAKEVLNWLNHSKMIGIFHVNSITSDEIFKARVALFHENMHLKSYGKKIMKKACTDTKYEAIMPLFESSTYIVFSPEEKVQKLLRIIKKYPQIVLIAGVVKDRLMSHNEFVEYSKMPDLQALQVQLVQTLNLAAVQLVNNLETHQKNLVNILDVYVSSSDESKIK